MLGLLLAVVDTRDLHGPDSDGPLTSGSGPLHAQARPGPTKAVSKGFLETIQYNAEFY